MAKISVIIPVYNSGKYLRECLNSILNQTFKDIEIICVNDGSTDTSFSILQEYASNDERIKIINLINRKGAGSARNAGLDASCGEYLYFMDSDDYADINILKILYNNIKKYNSDICICKCKYEKENDNRFYSRFVNFYSNLILIIRNLYHNNRIYNKDNYSDKLFQISNIAPYTKLYRKSFIIEHDIRFQEIETCNDVFFNYYTIACAGAISMVYIRLVTHRTGIPSLTANRGKHIDCLLSAFKKLETKLKEQGLYDKLRLTFYKRAKSCFKYELEQVKDLSLCKQWETELSNYLLKFNLETAEISE